MIKYQLYMIYLHYMIKQLMLVLCQLKINLLHKLNHLKNKNMIMVKELKHYNYFKIEYKK